MKQELQQYCIWREKRAIYGLLIEAYETVGPVHYLKLKAKMLKEDPSMSSIFRGVEKVIYKVK